MAKKIHIKVIKVYLPKSKKPIDYGQSFKPLHRLYLELLENKSKIKQDLVNKEHISNIQHTEKNDQHEYFSVKTQKKENLEIVDSDSEQENFKSGDEIKENIEGNKADINDNKEKYEDENNDRDINRDRNRDRNRNRNRDRNRDRDRDGKRDRKRDRNRDQDGCENQDRNRDRDRNRDQDGGEDQNRKRNDDDNDNDYDKNRDIKKNDDDENRDIKRNDDDDENRDRKKNKNRDREHKYSDDKNKEDSKQELSERLNELLNDTDESCNKNIEKSRNLNDKNDKYSRDRDDNFIHKSIHKTTPHYQSIHKDFEQPPTIAELREQGLYEHKEHLRDINQDNDQELEDKKRELLFKFDLLRKSYPNATVQDFSIHSDLDTMKKTYEDAVRRLSLDSTVENYKTYLIGGFMLVEFIFGNFLGLDMQGFAQQQILSMNSYEKLLIELGEKSYVPKGSKWPIELRLLFLIIMNAAFFIVSKMIMKKTGSNLMNMINGMNASSARVNTPQKKRKMKGPNIDLNDMPDESI